MPKKQGKKTIISCSCGYKSENADLAVIREEVIDKSKSVEVIDSEESLKAMPKMKAECPKCHNHEAYFWEVQTRAADEPATKFLRCTECHNIWRDYS